MSKAATRKIIAGVYEVNGSADKDGNPYRVERLATAWGVFDSRGRRVSIHASKADATASVEAGIDTRSFTDGFDR